MELQLPLFMHKRSKTVSVRSLYVNLCITAPCINLRYHLSYVKIQTRFDAGSMLGQFGLVL